LARTFLCLAATYSRLALEAINYHLEQLLFSLG
jgi:hypothetical protein